MCSGLFQVQPELLDGVLFIFALLRNATLMRLNDP